MDLPDPDRHSRRDYLRGLVAAGGAVGLSACLDFVERESPPQVARHQGYETAFTEMPPMPVEVPR